jgi:prephenate dehydrogenase
MSRATVVGVGLIGGSIAAGLRSAGWHVNGVDVDQHVLEEAQQRGIIDEIGDDSSSDVTFVCVPVGAMHKIVEDLLVDKNRVVTDVGSVKAPVIPFTKHPTFVAGHPMAGSEQDGVEHARGDLFENATWILCPSENTDAVAFAKVQDAVAALKSQMIAIAPEQHDELVARISHLPHIVACALMQIAAEQVLEDDASPILRLVGGGFRDMTRIAAGHPTLWADIVLTNADAIIDSIDRLQGELNEWREALETQSRSYIGERLARSRNSRRTLPVRGVADPDALSEIRIPIPDRPGVLAEVTMFAGSEGTNIVDIEIAHGPEGQAGLLMLIVPDGEAAAFAAKLRAQGYEPSVNKLD